MKIINIGIHCAYPVGELRRPVPTRELMSSLSKGLLFTEDVSRETFVRLSCVIVTSVSRETQPPAVSRCALFPRAFCERKPETS